MVKNEGEFKKRIDAKEQFIDATNKEGIASIGYIETVDINEIVEDAKKEFPNWQQLCLQFKEAYKDNRMDILTLRNIFADKSELWFKKWFGSEEG